MLEIFRAKSTAPLLTHTLFQIPVHDLLVTPLPESKSRASILREDREFLCLLRQHVELVTSIFIRHLNVIRGRPCA